MRSNAIGVLTILLPALVEPLCAEVAYKITTVAGSDFAGDGGPAVNAQLGQPQGIAVDRAGNIYVADASDHRVRKISPTGVITTFAGTGRSAPSPVDSAKLGDNGPAEWAHLNQPYGLALDASENLYIADFGNSRVRKVTPAGIIYTVAGGGDRLPTPEGGDAIQAQLSQPHDLAFDAQGNLYVSDMWEHAVYRVTPAGIMTKIAGSGGRGLSGDGGPAVLAQLDSPTALVVDRAGRLLIADSGNYRIRRIVGDIIETVPNTENLSSMPKGLALDGAGTLYVAISGRVLRNTSAGILPFAGTGVGANLGDGGPATLAKLQAGREIAFDQAGNLYISDERRLRKVTAATGIIQTIAGDGTFRPSGDGGQATTAHLATPVAIALDREGNLYISDRDHYRVRKVDATGAIRTVAGRGLAISAGDGGPAAEAGLERPAGITLDFWGNLWIADANRTRKVSAAGIISTVAGGQPGGAIQDGGPASSATLSSPAGVAADRAGNLYIADTGNHLIRKVTADGRIFSVAGKGVRGRGGDGGPALAAQLNNPSGVCVDSLGNLYIADRGNQLIRKITAGTDAAPVITTVAGTGDYGFSGDGSLAAAARLNNPSRVAVDGAGNLYVADASNHRIRKITTDGIITTIAGTGETGFSGDDGPALSAALNAPTDVAVDAAGNIFIADSGNDRIRKLTPSTDAGLPPGPVLEPIVVTSAASLISGPVAPGQIVSLFGTGLGPAGGVGVRRKGSGLIETNVADTQIVFDGVPAPLLYVQANQVNLIVPYQVQPQSIVEIEVRSAGAVRARKTVSVAAAAPGIFTLSDGTGQAAATNEDGTLNSVFNPAPKGSVVTLYATGEGQTNPAGIDGKLAEAPFPRPVLPVVLRIGGYRAELLYAGSAPGLAGVLQINARIPDYVAAGSQTVELLIGQAASQPGVTLGTK